MTKHHLQRMSQRLGLDRLSGEGWSVTYLTLMAALILMSYGLARGPSEALFLKELSSIERISTSSSKNYARTLEIHSLFLSKEGSLYLVEALLFDLYLRPNVLFKI